MTYNLTYMFWRNLLKIQNRQIFRSLHCLVSHTSCSKHIICCNGVRNNYSLVPITLIYKQSYCTSNANICWDCKKKTKYISDLFCEHCNSLRKLNTNQNYFEILDVKKQYDIDLTTLSKKYKQMQKLLHPDKFSMRPSADQEISLEWSSEVNKAYSTLSNPVNRAEYLLGLYNVTIPDESDTKNIEFLMEMMDKNEEIEEISDSDEILVLLTSVQNGIENMGDKLGEAIKSEDFNKAVELLRKMKYYYSLQGKIKNKATRLGAVGK